MDEKEKKKLTKTNSSINLEKTKQASGSSKDTVKGRHTNIALACNALLIWLDSNIDEEHDEDCRNTLTQLRCVMNTINTFTDDDQCFNFLSKINDEKVYMVISGSLGQHIVPKIHSVSQLDTIFIFCGNPAHHKQWAKDWPKIKGIFAEITSICDALQQAVQDYEYNTISISLLSLNDNATKNLDKLVGSFMYAKTLKEILPEIESKEQPPKQFIDCCTTTFAGNDLELSNVKKFERKYRDKTPIWWYTYDCFLYPMLNRALCTMDVDIIIKMGFFVADVHHHIEKLHSKQFGDHQSRKIFTVYRGQALSKADFDQMIKTKGGFISFNNFLFSSKDRKSSLEFACQAVTNSDLVAVLFVMNIDPSTSSIPFASINNVSYVSNTEDEILFSMPTVFHIHECKQTAENNRIWQVDLTLTGDDDHELQALTKHLHEETYPNPTGWDRLGRVLLKMGQPEKAHQVYEVILNQTSNNEEKANIYQQIGWNESKLGKYYEAIKSYQKSTPNL